MMLYILQGLTYLSSSFIVLFILIYVYQRIQSVYNPFLVILFPGGLLTFLWLFFSGLQSMSTTPESWLFFNAMVYVITIPLSTYVLYLTLKMRVASKSGYDFVEPSISDIYMLFPFLLINAFLMTYIIFTSAMGEFPNLWMYGISSDMTTGYGIYREVHAPLWYFHMTFSSIIVLIFLLFNFVNIITSRRPIMSKYSYYLAITATPSIITGLLLYFITTGIVKSPFVIDTTILGIMFFYGSGSYLSDRFYSELYTICGDLDTLRRVHNISTGDAYGININTYRSYRSLIEILISLMSSMGFITVHISPRPGRYKGSIYHIPLDDYLSHGRDVLKKFSGRKILIIFDITGCEFSREEESKLRQYTVELVKSMDTRKSIVLFIMEDHHEKSMSWLSSILIPLHRKDSMDDMYTKLSEILMEEDLEDIISRYYESFSRYHYLKDMRMQKLESFRDMIEDYYSSLSKHIVGISIKSEFHLEALKRLEDLRRVLDIIILFEKNGAAEYIKGQMKLGDILSVFIDYGRFVVKTNTDDWKEHTIPYDKERFRWIFVAFMDTLSDLADGDISVRMSEKKQGIEIVFEFKLIEDIYVEDEIMEILFDFISEAPLSVPLTLYTLPAINRHFGSGFYFMRTVLESTGGHWSSTMEPCSITITIPVVD